MPALSLPFALEDATVARVHAAYLDGSLAARTLVQAALARIAACDRQGLALQAMLAVHPGALQAADALDRQLRATGRLAGPLHGIPVVLKDNFDTHDLPTTSGHALLRDWRPARDATVVARLRAAGAIVLGKSNLQELARGGVSCSTLGGQVRNPYDLTRSAGGSSGGTGAALAAGYAVLGTGSDTGQSIRSPASACALVGVRPTRGLVSRAGVMPNSLIQDEVGPMARTAEDAARMLAVMAGFDPRDPVTALGRMRPSVPDLQALDPQALKGARIGVMENLFGREPRHAEVNAVMAQAVARMREQGATVLHFELPGFDALAQEVSVDRWEAAAAFEQYLAQHGPAAPVASFRALVQSGHAWPAVQELLEAELALADPLHDPAYLLRLANRERLRVLVAAQMATLQLDAILYPLQRILVVALGETEQPERNGVLSHGTGFPAVTFPAGFSRPDATAPAGVPVGAELLGLDGSEARLLALAHAYAHAAPPRPRPAVLAGPA